MLKLSHFFCFLVSICSPSLLHIISSNWLCFTHAFHSPCLSVLCFLPFLSHARTGATRSPCPQHTTGLPVTPSPDPAGYGYRFSSPSHQPVAQAPIAPIAQVAQTASTSRPQSTRVTCNQAIQSAPTTNSTKLLLQFMVKCSPLPSL